MLRECIAQVHGAVRVPYSILKPVDKPSGADAAFIKYLHGYCHGHQHSKFQELCCPVPEAEGR